MKKYTLNVMIISLLCISQIGMAMQKTIKTSLSSKEEAELRKAVINYKKNNAQSKQEQIINKYAKKYPHDPFVKAKLNEKVRFDNAVQSAPSAPTQPVVVTNLTEIDSVEPQAAPIKQAHFKILANRVLMQQATSQELALFVRESKKIINNMENSEKREELAKLVGRIGKEVATQKQIVDFVKEIIQVMDENEV
jgi:hypothetical protein